MSQVPYGEGPGTCEVIQKEVGKMLKIGVMEEGTTLWASEVVLKPKKDKNIYI